MTKQILLYTGLDAINGHRTPTNNIENNFLRRNQTETRKISYLFFSFRKHKNILRNGIASNG
jgi:hypothetical protein